MQTQELVKVKPVVVDGVKFYVSPDGSEVGVSVNGLARLAGVELSTVQTALGLHKRTNYKASEWLEHLAGELLSCQIEETDQAKVVNSKAAAEVIVYYAHESHAASATARHTLKQFTALGVDKWMRSQIKKATASREALVAHLDDVFKNSPEVPAKLSEAAKVEAAAVDTEILDTVKQLTERVGELQKALHKMNEQPQSNGQQHQGNEPDQPVQQEEKYYTVKEYLSKKGLVMSVKDLSIYAKAVCKEYRATNKKMPQCTKNGGSRAYSAADFPLLDTALAKYLGL